MFVNNHRNLLDGIDSDDWQIIGDQSMRSTKTLLLILLIVYSMFNLIEAMY